MRLFLAHTIIFAFAHLALAAFTQTTCRGNNCIQRNSAGTWCYAPASGATRATTCIGDSADFASVLEVHLAQGRSIAYYNGADNTQYPGGADWSVPESPGVIRLCMSGRSGDGNYQTTCVNAAADNALPQGGPSCVVIRSQVVVTDGCYTPDVIPPLITGSLTPSVVEQVKTATKTVTTVATATVPSSAIVGFEVPLAILTFHFLLSFASFAC